MKEAKLRKTEYGNHELYDVVTNEVFLEWGDITEVGEPEWDFIEEAAREKGYKVLRD